MDRRRHERQGATEVVDAAVGHEQDSRLQATMTAAFIRRRDPWLRRFGLGGDVRGPVAPGPFPQGR